MQIKKLNIWYWNIERLPLGKIETKIVHVTDATLAWYTTKIISRLLIKFFILATCLLVNVLLLYRENRFWSLFEKEIMRGLIQTDCRWIEINT